MKRKYKEITLILFLGILSFIACSIERDLEVEPVLLKNFDSVSFSHSMKGWELYSWPKGNEWYFSVLIGTNRAKTYQEVTQNKIIVMGIASLKMLLDRFPANEEIIWAGQGWLRNTWGSGYGNLSLPDEKTISEISNYCAQRRLILTVLK